jgi:hypothetical protein
LARFCHLCGRPLSGGADASGGHAFAHREWPPGLALHLCDDCAARKPRCLACGLPGNIAGLCDTCRRTGQFCLTCGRKARRRVMMGRYGPYCADCARNRPRCDICGLPVLDGGRLPADGRLTCAECEATAVHDPIEAQAIFRAAESAIGQQLGLSLGVPTALLLVGRDELMVVMRELGQEPDGAADTLGAYTRRGRRRGIYALSGLPRLLLLQVAAHEWAHAWQMENAPLMRDPVLREGFAEWIAYRLLRARGEAEAAERMLARDDIYGDGLRHLLRLEEQLGAPGVIEWCRRAR